MKLTDHEARVLRDAGLHCFNYEIAVERRQDREALESALKKIQAAIDASRPPQERC